MVRTVNTWTVFTNLGKTLSRNSLFAWGVNFATEGLIATKKVRAAPDHPITETIWNHVRVPTIIWSTIQQKPLQNGGFRGYVYCFLMLNTHRLCICCLPQGFVGLGSFFRNVRHNVIDWWQPQLYKSKHTFVCLWCESLELRWDNGFVQSFFDRSLQMLRHIDHDKRGWLPEWRLQSNSQKEFNQEVLRSMYPRFHRENGASSGGEQELSDHLLPVKALSRCGICESECDQRRD